MNHYSKNASRPFYVNLCTLCCFALLLIVFTSAFATSASAVVDEGYLFVDGDYVEPPYRIETTDTAVTVNGNELPLSYFGENPIRRDPENRSFDERHGPRFLRRDSYRRRNQLSSIYHTSPLGEVSEAIGMVHNGCIVIVHADVLPSVIPGEIEKSDALQRLTGSSDNDVRTVSALDFPNAEAVDRLVADFKPSQAFLTRAAGEITAAEQRMIAGEKISSSQRMLDRIGYPLTVFAMGAIVFGFGHLLNHRPPQSGQEFDTSVHTKVITKTLIIIGALSLIDLVWTVAASNAGAMRELNPLGSEMIHSPLALIAFKFIATGGAIAILYHLQQQKVAHTAAWWCCLVLTLLTARWVVFQSMFV